MFLGDIHIVDYDEVELSNLHRQILHHEGDIGVLKVHSASDKLRELVISFVKKLN
jgi:molybdopterin/thiamine biosynthesis adenylyltransferase